MSDRPITKLPWGLRNDKLAPGSMKTITETKIKAFQQGAMNIAKKTLSKRELEEIKRKQQEEEAAEVYKDFVASFEDPNKIGKTFVKGTTIQTGLKTTETPAVDRGRIYKPTSKLQELAETFSSFKACSDKNTTQTGQMKPRKQQEKRKTNLEAFKDELKRIQEERDRRHEIKRKIKEQEESGRKSRFEPYIPPENPIDSELSLDDAAQERYSSDDPNTTNIFLSNLSRTLNEMEIMEMFGQFGPLASVKIMYPRSDEERARGSNCGFVAFMNRRDAEVAITELDGFEVGGLRLRLSWGKQVHIPLQPVYVPPSLVEANLHPPPKSGYPFNAQPPPNFPRYPDVIKPTQQQIKQALENSVIKVIVPSDRKLLCLIHRTIEFVVREGPKFESLLMEKEKENPQFRFLFDNNLPTHIYYRWKLFSILQGDSVYQWRTGHFKMFKQGSLWIPPSVPIAKQDSVASYDESFERAKAEMSDRKNKSSSQKCDKMQEMLRNLTTERDLIADAMIYAIEHAHIADEIANAICRSLAMPDSTGPQKVAHLFLISDILHNCSFGVFNASSYRRVFEGRLPAVFENLHQAAAEIGGKVKTEQFKSKVIACFRAWEDWTVYPSDTLIKLQNIFLGLVKTDAASPGGGKAAEGGESEDTPNASSDPSQRQVDMGLIDDSDIDGQPIDDSEGAEYSAPVTTSKKEGEQIEDIDGEPLDVSDTDDGAPRISERGFFVSSKWETIDPETVTMEAMTTPRWNEIRQLDTSQFKDAASLELSAAQPAEPINSRSELRSRCNSFDSSLSVSQSSSTTANEQTRRSSSSSSSERNDARRGGECKDRRSGSRSCSRGPDETHGPSPDAPGQDRRLISPHARGQYRGDAADSNDSSGSSAHNRRRAHDRFLKTRGHKEGQQRSGRDHPRRSRRSTDSSMDSGSGRRFKSRRKRSRRNTSGSHSRNDGDSVDEQSSISSQQGTDVAKSSEGGDQREALRETRKSRELSPSAKACAPIEVARAGELVTDEADEVGEESRSSRYRGRQVPYRDQSHRDSARYSERRKHTRRMSPPRRSRHYQSVDDNRQGSRSRGGGMNRYGSCRQSDESDRPGYQTNRDAAGQREGGEHPTEKNRAGQFGRLSSSISASPGSDRHRKDGRRL